MSSALTELHVTHNSYTSQSQADLDAMHAALKTLVADRRSNYDAARAALREAIDRQKAAYVSGATELLGVCCGDCRDAIYVWHMLALCAQANWTHPRLPSMNGSLTIRWLVPRR